MKLKRKEQLNSMRRNIDMLKIEIETGGVAYRDEDGELDRSAYELRRNLKEIKEKLEYGYQAGYIMDINGNKVGNWTLED